MLHLKWFFQAISTSLDNLEKDLSKLENEIQTESNSFPPLDVQRLSGELTRYLYFGVVHKRCQGLGGGGQGFCDYNTKVIVLKEWRWGKWELKSVWCHVWLSLSGFITERTLSPKYYNHIKRMLTLTVFLPCVL